MEDFMTYLWYMPRNEFAILIVLIGVVCGSILFIKKVMR